MCSRKNMNVLLLIITMLIASSFIYAQAFAESQSEQERGKTVIASTSWVAGMVEAAGVPVDAILAPVELRHPPEYDFRPSDIIAATDADIIAWAGYEAFIKELVQAADIDQNRIVLVSTNNSPDVLRPSVKKLATQLGTVDSLDAWERQLDEFERMVQKRATETGTSSLTAAVQFHHQSLARWLGYDVVAVFGPQEMTLGQLQLIESVDPDVIIDNWHNASGQALANDTRVYVQLINFPGPGGTESILDVLEYNMTLLGLL